MNLHTQSLDKNSDFKHIGNVYSVGQNFLYWHFVTKTLPHPLPNMHVSESSCFGKNVDILLLVQESVHHTEGGGAWDFTVLIHTL